MSRKKIAHDKKFWIRVVCIVLVVLLAGSCLVSLFVS